jgi:hypothetical protein
VTGYRWLWVAWIVAFLVLEFIAIGRRRYQDTLSEFVWQVCKVTPGNTFWQWTALHIFLAGFLIWLDFHLLGGYFR